MIKKENTFEEYINKTNIYLKILNRKLIILPNVYYV